MTKPSTDGTGALYYRLEIVGWGIDNQKHEYVTHVDMEQNTTALKRIATLNVDGVVIEESVALPNAKLEIAPVRFTLIDNEANDVLRIMETRTTNAITPLRTNYEVGDLTLQVDDNDTFSAGAYVHLNNEVIQLGAKFFDYNYVNSARGQWGSREHSHWVQLDTGARIRPYVTDIPRSMEGRRVRLYRYEDGDDLQGDGTLIWRGIVDTEPSNEGIEWTFGCSGVDAVLNQAYGDQGAQFSLRGYWFPAGHEWIFSIAETNADSRSDLNASGQVYPGNANVSTIVHVTASGFYESTADIIEDFNGQLEAASFTGDRPQFVDWDGDLALKQSTAAAPRWIWMVNTQLENYDSTDSPPPKVGMVSAPEYADPEDKYIVNDYHKSFTWTHADNVAKPRAVNADGSLGVPVDVVESNKTYIFTLQTPWPQIFCPFVGRHYWHEPPPVRLYINSDTLPADLNLPVITGEIWGHSAGGRGLLGSQMVARSVQDFDTNNRWVEIIPQNIFGTKGRFTATDPEQYKVTIGPKTVLSGNFADFNELVTSQSLIYGNSGWMPYVTDDEIDVDDMHQVVNRLATNDFLQKRNYTFWGAGKQLSEIWAEEAKILRAIPTVTSNGKLSLVPLRHASITDVGTYAADADIVLTDQQSVRTERNTDGFYNIARLKWGYDAIEDDWVGYPEYVGRSIPSMGFYQNRRELSLAPFSNATTPLSQELALQITEHVVSFFGNPYRIITFDAPHQLFDARIGDVIRLTDSNTPTLSGSRGVTNLPGVVVRRSWDLGTGFGEIGLMVAEQPSAFKGYTPTLKPHTTQSSGGSPFQYTFVVSSSVYSAPGFKDLEFWNAGDVGYLYEFDKHNAIPFYFTVVEVNPSADTITIQAESGVGSKNVRLTYAFSYEVTSDQQDWLYVASGSISGPTESPAGGADTFS